MQVLFDGIDNVWCEREEREEREREREREEREMLSVSCREGC